MESANTLTAAEGANDTVGSLIEINIATSNGSSHPVSGLSGDCPVSVPGDVTADSITAGKTI